MSITHVFSLLGGLALFLYGMDLMGKSLERQAGSRLQKILSRLTENPFKGFLLGLAVTAVIQSSSATTVMVVGFVNSGIMELHQAIGIIMGSNVGTTVTSWILSLTGLEGDSLLIQLLKPSTFSPLLAFIGVLLYLFGGEKKKGVGGILIGFAILMTGMTAMSDAVSPLDWWAHWSLPSSRVPAPAWVFCRPSAPPASSPTAVPSPSSWARTSAPAPPL